MRAGSALAVLLALLPLAGCVGTEDEPPQDATPAAVPPAAGDEAKDAAAPTQTPTEPAPEPSRSDTPPAKDAEDAPAPAPVTTPVSAEGVLGTAFCVPAGPNSCFGGPVTDNVPYIVLSAPGEMKRATLSLTWTAATPLTTELSFILERVAPCGENCYEGTGWSEVVRGPSPLALDFELPALNPGEVFLAAVAQPRMTPEPVYAFARVEQPFAVEGSLVSLA